MNTDTTQQIAPELNNALRELEQAVIHYAELVRKHGTLPQKHTGSLRQIAALLDNWRNVHASE